MPEGVGSYPRWQGELQTFPMWTVIAGQEIRRAWNNVWARSAITLVLVYSVVYVGSLYSASQGAPASRIHTLDNYLNFVNLVRWGSLVVAAIMAGNALLEDSRKGALELYLARAVTRTDYLLGKLLAVVGLTWLVVVGPALIYFGMSFVVFEEHPAGWNWLILTAPVYALIWAVVIAGLGLGLASVAKSARAASLLLFGGVAVLDVVLTELLAGITRNQQFRVLSPLDAHYQISEILFKIPPPYAGFPSWWAVLALLVFAIVGWGLVAWKHPRLRGVD